MFVNTNRNFTINLGTNSFADSTNDFAGGGFGRRGRGGFGGTNGFAGGGFGRGGFARNFSTNQIERIPATNTYAMGVRDYDEPQDVPVYYRGDLTKPTDAVVPRGFLRIVALSNVPEIPTNSSGRLQLAQWITDPENPLPARVAVNRVWQHLFGDGIVATPDNFGHLGSRPVNQELLDYLAAKFVTEQNWSVKQLVRSLVLSHTYQLSSDINEVAENVDPANTLLWRSSPRRLTAEQLRDSILVASGRLDLQPPHFSVAAQFGDGYYGVNIWESDLPQHYYKRSIYLPIPRDMVPEALSLFDLPNPNLVGAKREETTSPSQALFLMNNAFVQDESLHLARQLIEDKHLSDKERILKAYLAVFQRVPTSDEVKGAGKFIKEETSLLATASPDEIVSRTSTPEPNPQPATPAAAAIQIASPAPESQPATPAAIPATMTTASPAPVPALMAISLVPKEAPETPVTTSPPAAGVTNALPTVAADVGAIGSGNGGYRRGFGGRGGFRGQRTYNGPGSASDVVVGKLAPGVAQPPVFHQALPEKPATPQEGALALFTQALFGSAEFRYLQ
jgi:hypothetical protein